LHHDAFFGVVDTPCYCATKLAVESSHDIRTCLYDRYTIHLDFELTEHHQIITIISDDDNSCVRRLLRLKDRIPYFHSNRLWSLTVYASQSALANNNICKFYGSLVIDSFNLVCHTILLSNSVS